MNRSPRQRSYNRFPPVVSGDVYVSAEFRAGVAPVEVKHALMHAIGLAHH